MEQQLQFAKQRAIQVKGDRYGVDFTYEVNGKVEKEKTEFGFKTVGDLMNKIVKKQVAHNLWPFDLSNNDVLGYDMLLAEVKNLSIKPLNEQDMIYVHFIVKNNSQSYLFNKLQVTVKNAIQEYNKDREVAYQIENYKSLEIMGKQIDEGVLNRYLHEVINGEQGYIMQLI